MPGNFPPPKPPLPGAEYDSSRDADSARSLEEVTGDLKLLWDFIAKFEEVEITGKDGRSYTIMAIDGGVASSGLAPWSLVSVGQGQYFVSVGRILNSERYDDVTEEIQINGSKTISPNAGDVLYLEQTVLYANSVTMKIGSQWTGYPKQYSYTTDGDDVDTFDKYRFPIYEFLSSNPDADDPGSQIVELSDGLFARSLISGNLMAAITSYQSVTGAGSEIKIDDYPITVPVFMLSHGPLSS